MSEVPTTEERAALNWQKMMSDPEAIKKRAVAILKHIDEVGVQDHERGLAYTLMRCFLEDASGNVPTFSEGWEWLEHYYRRGIDI